MRFLVTAGNTREKIDSVRQWSNIFTGNTGFGIAKALAAIGEVDLLTSNQQHLAELKSSAGPIRGMGFTDHANLRTLLAQMMRDHSYHAVLMSAAVADYRPTRVYAVVSTEPVAGTPGQERWIVQDVQAGKVKSTHDMIAVLGARTEKLVDFFRKEWNYRRLLVKFKLEVGISRDELIRIGQASRISSGAEYLVANTLEMTQGTEAGAYLLSDEKAEWVPRGELSARLVRVVADHLSNPQFGV